VTLFCSPCVTMKEIVEAVTVHNGTAVCIRHLADAVHHDNPHIPEMSAQDWREQVQRGWRSGRRWDADGAQLPG
jgi:hypothetical protein